MGGIYWLASYPKSGNTWLRTFLANLTSGSDQPVDINHLNVGQIASNRTWIDDIMGFDTADMRQDEVESLRPHAYRWKYQGDQISYHKIHDAYTLTREGRPLVDDLASLGAIYVIRNPLDVAPSYANHRNTDIDEAITLMGDPQHALARARTSLPVQLLQFMGSWSGHVQSWVDNDKLPVMTIRYEDMHAMPERTFGDAARFLGLAPEPRQLARALRHSSFDEVSGQEARDGFRERPPGVKRFFRKGLVGDWRNVLTLAQVSRIVSDHGDVMQRFGYLDGKGNPV